MTAAKSLIPNIPKLLICGRGAMSYMRRGRDEPCLSSYRERASDEFIRMKLVRFRLRSELSHVGRYCFQAFSVRRFHNRCNKTIL